MADGHLSKGRVVRRADPNLRQLGAGVGAVVRGTDRLAGGDTARCRGAVLGGACGSSSTLPVTLV